MALSFSKVTKIPSAALPKAVAKFAGVVKSPKFPSIKIKSPSVPSVTSKSFNFSKFSRVKAPKAAKVAVLKKAVTKAKKNVGF